VEIAVAQCWILVKKVLCVNILRLAYNRDETDPVTFDYICF